MHLRETSERLAEIGLKSRKTVRKRLEKYRKSYHDPCQFPVTLETWGLTRYFRGSSTEEMSIFNLTVIKC